VITFRRIPTVAVGDRVTSIEMVGLANGINDRIRSGLGDCARRIHFLLSSGSRQIRNPDSSGFLFPPVDEFRAGYEHLKPNDYTWPVSGPGEPEGANLASVLGSFVFGADALNLPSEDLRLSDPIEGGVDMDFGTGTARELWEMAKRQRGAIDGGTGVVACPAFNAAKSHFAIIASDRSPHGNAYGGYQPVPEILGDCGDGDSTTEPTPHVQLIFTSINPILPNRTFEGYCSSIPTHVAGVLYYPNQAYVIYQFNGTVTVLKWTDYIEGPYTFGNRLRKSWGNLPNRYLNFFASQFRGTPTQRLEELSGEKRWMSQAFDIHGFLTSQYHLAPQRGISSGDTVTAEYPQWQLTGATSFASETVIPRSNATGTTHSTASGFLCASVLVHSQGLVGTATVDILDGLSVIGSVTLDTETPSRIVTLETAQAFAELRFIIRGEVRLQTSTSAHGIVCEATELWTYKPALWDLALVLRLAGARMGLENGTDGDGQDEDQAAEISQDYFASGCIINRRLHIALPGSFAEINTNAVFEAARRYGNQCSRQLPRNSLVGYEVTGGKSILYFRRLWNGISQADVFDAIAPAREYIQSGSLQEGRQYVAKGGSIIYNGNKYSEGSKWTAVEGVFEWSSTDAGLPYEANGILTDALPGGWSNEWVLDVFSLLPYQTLDTSLWKVDSFTDYVSMFTDRCTWMHPSIRPATLTRHFHYGIKEWTAPESFPSYRYAEGINALPCADLDTTCEEARRRKLRSCPIGELPLVIESVESITEDGEERVKITLSGRLHHGSDAPSSIDRDFTTWSLATIQAEIESGRTAENGIREYLINQFVGGNCVGPGTQYGNAAHNSNVAFSLDVPFGSCYPRIGLTRLVPKPYYNGLVDYSPKKTPMDSWVFGLIELYARAICEGFVDRISTEQYGCETGVYAVLDFTFESACVQAFGGRSFGCVQSTATEYRPEEETRPDKPLFHGPLPNTFPSAEVFNQFAAFFNLLTDVRLMLPIVFQTRFGVSETVEVKKLYEADGTEHGCSTGQVIPGAFNKFDPVLPPTPSLGSYADAVLSSAQYTMAIDDFACDGSGDWRLVHGRVDEQFKWSLLHPDYLEAIPVEWQDMIETNGLLLGVRERLLSYQVAQSTTPTNGEPCNAIADFWSGGGGEVIKFPAQSEYTLECKLLPQSERLTPPLPPSSAIGVGRVFDSGDLIYCVVNASGVVTVTPIEADAMIIAVNLV